MVSGMADGKAGEKKLIETLKFFSLNSWGEMSPKNVTYFFHVPK